MVPKYKSKFMRYVDVMAIEDLLIRRIPKYEKLITDTFAEVYDQGYTNMIEIRVYGKELMDALKKEDNNNA